MRIEVDRYLGVDWPSPLNEAAPQVLMDLVGRLDGLDWFVMGRTLLNLYRSGNLGSDDTDIDFGVRSDDFETVCELLDDWPFAVRTTVKGKYQQAMWYPQGVLVDCHVFYPTVSYISMRSRYVTRRPSVFDTETFETSYGRIRVPGDPERYLTDDYGAGWRSIIPPPK